MNAEELLQAGRLEEAIAAQTQEVKSSPTDPDRRFLLFVLLCLAGELERADLQLDAITVQDESLQPGSLVFRSLLSSELERRKVYREGATPVLPPDPPPSVERRVAALHHLQQGDAAGAERALEEAVAGAVELHGKLDGEAFDNLRDYDDVLGQTLELYAGGRYLWLPFERIRKLEIRPPKTQIDLLWAKAELEDTDDNQATVHIPVLYEGSHEHADPLVRLGRSTEWIDQHDVAFRGAGQRLLLTVQGETERESPILRVRTLELEGPTDGS